MDLDQHFNIVSGNLSGSNLNSEFQIEGGDIAGIQFKPLDKVSISSADRQKILDKWQITDSQLNNYIDVIAHNAIGNAGYDINHDFLSDLLGTVAYADVEKLQDFAGKVASNTATTINIATSISNFLMKGLVELKRQLSFWNVQFEAQLFNKKPSNDVSELYDFIFNKIPPAAYFDGASYAGGSSLTPSQDTVQYLSLNGQDGWQTEANVALLSLKDKVSVIGESIVGAVAEEEKNFIAEKEYTDPTIIDKYARRFNDGTAGEALSTAAAYVDMANKIAAGILNITDAFSNGQGIYHVELQRKVYSDGKSIYRWVAYYQIDDNSPKVYVSNPNGADFIKSLLLKATRNK